MRIRFTKFLFASTVAICLPAVAAYLPSYTIISEQHDLVAHADATYSETLQRVVRVNTTSGTEQWGEVSRSFDPGRASMKVEHAYVVQPDGRRVDVAQDSIQTRDANVDGDAPFFGSDKEVYIIFPDVRVGSELHYAFHKDVNEPAYPGRFSWLDYQYPHVPVLKSDVNVSYAPDIKMRFATRGGYKEISPSTEIAAPKGYLKKSFTFSLPDAVPYESESVADIDTGPMVVISNYADWADVGLTYDKAARPNSQPNEEISALASRIVGTAQDTKTKVKKLHQWVAQNIRYVGTGLSAGGYVPNPAPIILKNRYGDCKDHAALLEAMLTAAGIDSTPVLINSGRSYKLTPIASDWPFDHVINYIPSLDLFVDSTSRYDRTGALPQGDMGKPVVLARTGEIKYTPMPSPERDAETVETKWVLHPTGDMIGTSRFRKTGWYEGWSRAYHVGSAEADQVSQSRNYLKGFGESGSGTTRVPSSDDWSVDWIVRTQTSLQGHVNLPEPSAFSIPVGLAPGGLARIANTAPPLERTRPWRCINRRIVETSAIEIPDSVEVQHVPKSVIVDEPQWQYQSSYAQHGRTLRVQRELVLRFNSPSCDADLAPAWAKFVQRLRRDVRSQVFTIPK